MSYRESNIGKKNRLPGLKNKAECLVFIFLLKYGKI